MFFYLFSATCHICYLCTLYCRRLNIAIELSKLRNSKNSLELTPTSHENNIGDGNFFFGTSCDRGALLRLLQSNKNSSAQLVKSLVNHRFYGCLQILLHRLQTIAHLMLEQCCNFHEFLLD